MRLRLSYKKNVVCHEINLYGLLFRVDESFSFNLLPNQKNHFEYGGGFHN